MVSAEEICGKLQKTFDDAMVLEVEDKSGGCGNSFELLIVSDQFDKMTPLGRQRQIHTLLREEMKTIHALTQRLYTVAQYEKKQKEKAEDADTDAATTKEKLPSRSNSQQ
ncbi:hypothetical protein GGI25_002740 [Coemansia spiralis]|uniref:Bola-like protein n=2 Tax=Coemansia TaxID=4863 RepID=A0A9W8G9X5_9FUNG|nr:bola protein [Coemansia spiralis]KAJ1993514.1 hypothetical protein EDC05_002140 [Coemansia umbellata]KAJ2625243.1 hypothetical protein GGI26_000713 [Coemansia sp. RSA 1358]KAJ2677950.1 hypothetical protein GGI25_002740 [Coemansia spiralis]